MSTVVATLAIQHKVYDHNREVEEERRLKNQQNYSCCCCILLLLREIYESIGESIEAAWCNACNVKKLPKSSYFSITNFLVQTHFIVSFYTKEAASTAQVVIFSGMPPSAQKAYLEAQYLSNALRSNPSLLCPPSSTYMSSFYETYTRRLYHYFYCSLRLNSRIFYCSPTPTITHL